MSQHCASRIYIKLFLQADDLKAETTRQTLALPAAFTPEEPRKITEEEKGFEAFKTLRVARADQRYEGARKKRQQKVCPRCYSYSDPADLFSPLCRRTRRRQRRRSKPVTFASLCSLIVLSMLPLLPSLGLHLYTSKSGHGTYALRLSQYMHCMPSSVPILFTVCQAYLSAFESLCANTVSVISV